MDTKLGGIGKVFTQASEIDRSKAGLQRRNVKVFFLALKCQKNNIIIGAAE